MPATQVQGHQDLSPLCRAGTTSVTPRAMTHSTVPTTAIRVAETCTVDRGADGPRGVDWPTGVDGPAGFEGPTASGVSGWLTGTA